MSSTLTQKAAIYASVVALVNAADNGIALTPPMGWRSWNCFHGNVNQTKIEGQVDALVLQNASRGDGKSLLDHGYQSIGLDDNWQACHTGINNSFHDAQGHPLINTKTFPSMKDMVDYGHSKGVKMGWYLNNCICNERGSLEPNWSPQMHGDVNALSAAGWDGVKIDSCGPSHDLAEWYQLLNATGKAIEIENCHDNTSFPYVDASGDLQCPHHFFRVSGDINPSWGSVTRNLQCSIKFNQLKDPITRPGCWAYPDMLEVGNNMASTVQSRSHFGAWVITSAPLILGLDLADDAKVSPVWDVITNDEAINISQTYFLHPGFLVVDKPSSAEDQQLLRDLQDQWERESKLERDASLSLSLSSPSSSPSSSPLSSSSSSSMYLWAVPPNASDASQGGWSFTNATGALANSAGGSEECLAHAGGGFEFDACNATLQEQDFEFDDNGNLHVAGDLSTCLASEDFNGPRVVSFKCNTGVNEEWTLFETNGSICSQPNGGHPVLCLAKRSTQPSPPGPSPSPGAASYQVYAKPQPNNSMAVLLFNMDSNAQQVSVDLASLGFQGASVHVRDVWARAGAADVKSTVSRSLDAYDSAFLLLSPADPKDQSGDHPYTKLLRDSAQVASIEAAQKNAFARVHCSYSW